MSLHADPQEAIDRLAKAALARYGFSESATATLVNLSENATYRVDDPTDGRRAALRVHRLDYHPPGAIESELQFMDMIRDDAGVRTPTALRTLEGERVALVGTAELARPREVVAFDWIAGQPPREDEPIDDLLRGYRRLGAITARMHRATRAWTPPAGFVRFTWDYDTALGGEARWGRWQDAMNVGPGELDLLGRVDAVVKRRLAAFGKGPDRFGLVHADLRHANTLVDGDETIVIDFDDCGYCWYLYDLATTVTFFEQEPHVPDLLAAWIEGYREEGELSAADEAEVQTFVMLRRLLILAWIGSHHMVPEAQALGETYARDSLGIAEHYLSTHG